ncbi:hypothetical protein [Williamwhitmania taraxaci]|uniref:Uncharacterized protein n=1 Tax=Williamwhitmania taraxaci TaxID=1640674 RepID=A0A1G6L2I8_9BACT|nr:hypothetical protein [Williamwhitmania taraxaci]SDC37298.1 hypothetical protein SAMN05216323_102832 [Williamwhitmania taraxaci]
MKEEDYDYNLCYEDWLHYYRNALPSELVSAQESHYQELYYLYRVFTNVLRQFQPAAYQLMLTQFPRFKEETRPLVIDRLQNIINKTGQTFLLQLFLLIYEQRAGVNVHEKYPDFEKYQTTFNQNKKRDTMVENLRKAYPPCTDEEWFVFRDELNVTLDEHSQWKKTRELAYTNLLQDIVLSQFSLIDEINPDEWIIYALWLLEDYGDYYYECDFMCSFFDSKLPEEDIKLNRVVLHDKIMALIKERDNHNSRPIDK